jgi:hypothetical protein
MSRNLVTRYKIDIWGTEVELQAEAHQETSKDPFLVQIGSGRTAGTQKLQVSEIHKILGGPIRLYNIIMHSKSQGLMSSVYHCLVVLPRFAVLRQLAALPEDYSSSIYWNVSLSVVSPSVVTLMNLINQGKCSYVIHAPTLFSKVE